MRIARRRQVDRLVPRKEEADMTVDRGSGIDREGPF
jgi:hypothetical protein